MARELVDIAGELIASGISVFESKHVVNIGEGVRVKTYSDGNLEIISNNGSVVLDRNQVLQLKKLL